MSTPIAVLSFYSETAPELTRESLPSKARLIHDLASLGLRIPETVCIRIPLSEIWQSAYHHIQQSQLGRIVDKGVALLEELLGTGEGGERRREIALAVRSAIPSSSARPWSLLRVPLVSANGSTERSLACAAIERWAAESMKVLALQEDCTEEFSFLIQRMVAPRADIGHALGHLWTMHPTIGREGPFGFFFEQTLRKQSQVLSFEEWAASLPAYADEIVCWVRTLNASMGSPCRLRLVVGYDGLHVVSVHRGMVTGSVAREFLRKAIDSGAEQARRAVLSVRVDSVFGCEPLSIEQRAMLTPVAFGLSIGQGVACGRLATSEESVRQLASEGYPVIWAREEFEPKHVSVFSHVVGLVVDRAGPASHVVVLARGLGIAVVPGVRGLRFPLNKKHMLCDAMEVRDGEWLTLDEASGSVLRGRIELLGSGNIEVDLLQRIASQCHTTVLVNADSARAIEVGLLTGAQGVGLCRSESHLFEEEAAGALAEYLKKVANFQQTEAPEIVLETLRRRLKEVLRAAGGSWVHYRLLDPNPEDFVGRLDSATATHLVAGALGDHGCRWGLRSGFYQAQMEVISHSIATARAAGITVQLAVIVPFVVSLGEVAECKLLFQRLSPLFEGDDQVRLRFGCMIETPRAGLLASRIATLTDVLCLGTNDLTQTVWAWSREGLEDALHYYIARALVRENPFVSLDGPGVGEMLTKVVKGTKGANPNTEIVVCGEQAGDASSIAILHEMGADAVSCSASRVPAAILASLQAQIRREVNALPGLPQSVPDMGTAERLTRLYLSRTRSARSAQDTMLGHRLASEWSNFVSARLGLGEVNNWKFFKRDLVAHFFGGREHRRFMQGWNTNDMMNYALSLKRAGHAVRYSVFPAEIACHAISRVLDARGEDEQWRQELETLDHSTPVEVFPQQPEDQVCMRAIFSEWKLDIEMGRGQAMYVFEQERGRHPVIRGVVDSFGRCELLKDSASIPTSEELWSLAGEFISERGFWLFRRLAVITESLGLPWLGVEGYWSAVKREEPFICDIDLPLDLAFHG